MSDLSAANHGDSMIEHYLVYATACSQCRAVAMEVAEISDGLFRPLSYDQAVTRFGPASVPVGEPSIVSVRRGNLTVRRGPAMARFAVRRLGIRRSIKLKQLLDDVPADSSRRSFFRTAVGGMLVVAGMGAATPAAAEPAARMVEAAELEQLVRRASRDAAFGRELHGAAGRGFDTGSPVNVVARWSTGRQF